MGLENPLNLVLLLAIVLVVFGAKRIPELGRSLGEGIRGFKDSLSGEEEAHPSKLATPQSEPEQPGDSARSHTAGLPDHD